MGDTMTLPSDMGLKIGLEIHQQLDTKKLFCPCDSKLLDTQEQEIYRRLYPKQSEMGDVDAAAFMEALRGRGYVYQMNESSCLVEADEEPPHDINPEAVEITLTICKMMNVNVFDEIYIMRKIVIDGSNTTGFQRTALVGFDGYIEISDGKRIRIETVCLEEDAARKIEDRGNYVVYRLDRLGIPLIEIATAPEITTPQEAKEAAYKIGAILRATGRVKRGLGTIRQDLNVSIRRGARVEIKGVQNLDLIPKVIELEAIRQTILLSITEELKNRGVREDDLENATIIDLTPIVENCNSKVVHRALKSGYRAYGMKLQGFRGLIGPIHETFKDYDTKWIRLGKEFASMAKNLGLRGIIHSDELPAYGITKDYMVRIEDALHCDDDDGYIIVLCSEKKAIDVLNMIKSRSIAALRGVPQEVRKALEDGTTEYMRPMPSAARMYPETDATPVLNIKAKMKAIGNRIPEMPDVKIRRYIKDLGLSSELARQIATGYFWPIFEALVRKSPNNAAIYARLLTSGLSSMEIEGEIEPERLEYSAFKAVEGYIHGKYSKEGIEDVFKVMYLEGLSMDEAIKKLKLETIDLGELEAIIKRVVDERIEFVKQRGLGALGPLMGIIMKEVRGKIDGKVVSNVLKNEIQKRIEKS